MSTYLYLTCLDHDPPLTADDESGQHLEDLPEIRDFVAHREFLVRDFNRTGSVSGYFQNNTVAFLAKHPLCHLAITSETGEVYEV